MGTKQTPDGQKWRAQLQVKGDRCYNGVRHDGKEAQMEHFL